MGKHQEWFVTACVFLFLSLASQIHSLNQPSFLQRLIWSKQGIGALHDTKHFNAVRRLNSASKTINGVNHQSSKEKDLIKRLPGQPIVNFKQYSGYVTVNETAGRNLFYYFVEAIKPTASTPLILWFNGGPGCSSLNGAFAENGPFRVHSDGKTLYRNPYSWNNEANVLYVEAPAGVGFSYQNNITMVGSDKMTAEDNYVFLVKWLERFPEYKGKELFLTGQSYAGHYVPQLAQLVLHRKNQTFINLQGVMIGNPGLNYMLENEVRREFMVTHALISEEVIDAYKNLKCGESTSDRGKIEKCLELYGTIDKATEGVNERNIYAPVCLKSTLTTTPNKDATVMDYEPCSAMYLAAYLNTQKVQKIMNVKVPYVWEQCNGGMLMMWSEQDRYVSMIPTIHDLMGQGIRVWVYSGDVDFLVNVQSTMHVVKKMNLTIEKNWRPWFSSEGQLAGFIEEYKNNFKFITVRGAGHYVPTDQPMNALSLFSNFLRNNSLPLK